MISFKVHKMYTCYLCKGLFESVLLFRRHITSRHLSKFNRGQMKCGQDGCRRIYSELNSFGKHLHTLHPVEKKNTNDSPAVSDILSELSSLTSIHSNNTPSSTIVPMSTRGFNIQENLCHLTAQLYSNPQIPRNVVQIVVENIKCFTRSYNETIIDAFDTIESEKPAFLDLLKDFENIFHEFDSEYKIFKYFEKKGTFIPSYEHILGTFCEFSNKSGYHSVSYTMQVVPINLVLQAFFSFGDTCDEVIKYVQNIDIYNEEITNIMQGSIWRKAVEAMVPSENVINLPIILFYDDFEVNNPLGSHAGYQKIGAVYISLPFLPQKMVSLVENIFLLAFFHTSDRCKFGNKSVFKKCIEELNILSSRGILVKSKHFNGVLKFHVVALSGDNLGLNSMLGFVESFNSSHYCRMCRSSKIEVQSIFREDASKLRTLESYFEDLTLDDPKSTGIKSECVWFPLIGFNLFENVTVDLLHDYLEGCCRYTMDFLLRYIVQESKLISLKTLESRIARFDYGPDCGSKPNNCLIIDGSKIRFKTSASEMKSLVMYFGLIAGTDVAADNTVWELYISLRQVLDLLLGHRITSRKIASVSHYIEDFLEKYTTITGSNIKPKFHFLVHYSQMFLKFGPLTQVWTMRFEAKHQIAKIAARASRNRMNISKTLALRNQLYLNYRFLHGNSIKNFLRTGKSTLLHPNSHLANKLFEKIKSRNDINDYFSTVPWILFEGIKLVISSVVTVTICPLSYKPLFALIKNIIVNNSIVHFECDLFETHYFDEHYFAYLVTPPTRKEPSILLEKSELYTLVPNTLSILPNNQNFITVRFSLD